MCGSCCCPRRAKWILNDLSVSSLLERPLWKSHTRCLGTQSWALGTGSEVCFTPGKQEIFPLRLKAFGLWHSLPQEQSCPTRSEPSTSGNPKAINSGNDLQDHRVQPSAQHCQGHHKAMSLCTTSMCFLNPSRDSDCLGSLFQGLAASQRVPQSMS